MASRKTKSVLGNDPFKRGAAPRPALNAPPPRAKTPKKKAERPTTPELQTAQAPSPGPSKPVPAPRAPRAHEGSPDNRVDPQPHAGTPIATPLGSAPRPHPGSPTLVVDPLPHAAAPVATVLDGPTPHAGSPSSADPQPHAASPRLDAEPIAHADAPTAGTLPDRPLDDAVPTLGGALRGFARAVRSAVGLSSRATAVDAWGKDAELTRSLRPLAELLYDKYWRVQTRGIEHVPSGPCILVANHAGALPLDGPVLHLALRKERPDLVESRWLLEDQVFHAPFVGVLANRLGAVRASPENAHRLLDEGRPLIVFPEGFHGLSKPFAERYQLRRFGRGGYLKIALRARVPVIPVAIVGGEESMPLLGRLPGTLFGVDYLPVTLPPLPAKWHLSFAEPVDLSSAPSDPEHDLSWVEQKNLEVRDHIERMLAEQLAARPGVF